jgi:DNA gyrase inhibitor GyrI
LDQQKAQQTNQVNQQKLQLQQEKVNQTQQPGGRYAA